MFGSWASHHLSLGGADLDGRGQHDPSKCWEYHYDADDTDCCGTREETGCRDGYSQRMSEEKCCDWDWCDRSFFYTCVPLPSGTASPAWPQAATTAAPLWW